MVRRLVVVGGDAAGMTAASAAKKRAGDALDVLVLERGQWTSYSACGIPYWVSGDVDGPGDLVVRTPQEHRAAGIDVRMGSEVLDLDIDGRTVGVRDSSGQMTRERWDDLLLATGAEPLAPSVPGADATGVYGLQTLDDGAAVLAELCGSGARSDSGARSEPGAASRPRTAVVVGGGYIGVEMAEACLQRGLAVTLVDRAPEPMPRLDPDLGRQARTVMEGLGIQVLTGVDVEAFETDDSGHVVAVRTSTGRLAADVVLLGIGVRPFTDLAAAAGLPLGSFGGLRTDERMAVAGQEGVWAAGDCVEVWDRVGGEWQHVPLGTHANKQGRVVGLQLTGGELTFPGVVGTAITRVCDLELAITGLNTARCAALGLDAVVATIESTTRAGYFPGAAPITVRVTAERGTRRLLGGQVVGHDTAGKRIDTLALALWNSMTVDDLMMSDLSYAPPFSPVWDPVLVAARKAVSLLDGS
jgi:NADPH-dependent 2,4-dienoyl-CoA reductase/sulfur reductase-like enzyme